MGDKQKLSFGFLGGVGDKGKEGEDSGLVE